MSGLVGKRKRRIILLLANLGLLALFVWALSETVPLQVEVASGQCTAILDGRTNTVPCPGLAGGQVGLYNLVDGDQSTPVVASDPWRQLIPGSSWRSVSVTQLDGSGQIRLLGASQPSRVTGEWRMTAGELQPMGNRATMQWLNPLPGGFRLEAALRRPVDRAGLLLLQPSGDDGWLFLYETGARLGVWQRWQDGRPAEPLLGAPLQKSLTAQVQSLLSQVLLGHQAGLILLLVSWLLALVLAGIARRLRPAAESAPASGVRLGYRDRAILGALLLWVFAGSLFVAGDLLGSIPHVQDSITYRFQAQTLARGRLTAPAPPEPAAFEQEFLLVQDGRWFGKYPPGYPLLLAAGELLGLPWLVNPLLATLTAALLFALGRSWYGRRVGLLAALLAAVSPFFLIMSGTFMAHTAELFWVVLFMVAWTRIVNRSGPHLRAYWPWLLAAGLSLGMTALTRQLTALAVIGPFALASTVARLASVPWSRRARDLAALAVMTAPFAALLLLYQAAVAGDPFQDPRLLYWSYDHLGFGQDIGQGQNVATFGKIEDGQILVWQHDPEQPPRGHSPARGVFNLERNWRHLQSHLFGWLPAFTMAFAWLVFALGRANRADWVFLIVALSLMGVYVFYWADGIAYGPRYLYAALPALLLLVARGIQLLALSIGGRAGQRAVGLILAAFIAGALLAYFPGVLQGTKQYNFVDEANVAAVESAIDGPALVFVAQQHGDWWEYGNYFAGNTPWLDGRIIYARDLGPATNQRLLQRYPERAAYKLQGHSLRQLAPIRP